MRAVFDTNIFVSALVHPGGQAEKAVLGAVDGKFELAISKPVIHEVLDVLARKFDRNAEELARVAVFLTELTHVVNPRKTVRVLRDDPDNRVLECAAVARADVIVTGDRAMLALKEYAGIRLLTLRQFLAFVDR